jgi:hypothetical protein
MSNADTVSRGGRNVRRAHVIRLHLHVRTRASRRRGGRGTPGGGRSWPSAENTSAGTAATSRALCRANRSATFKFPPETFPGGLLRSASPSSSPHRRSARSRSFPNRSCSPAIGRLTRLVCNRRVTEFSPPPLDDAQRAFSNSSAAPSEPYRVWLPGGFPMYEPTCSDLLLRFLPGTPENGAARKASAPAPRWLVAGN